MGADQSASASPQLRSQRDEDIPYTSYSISKPIDGVKEKAAAEEDTPRASPRLTSKAKGQQPKEPPRSSAVKHDIVVVKEMTVDEEPDSELQKLEGIPVFLPIMRGTLNLPLGQTLQESTQLDKLDTRTVLQLCARYQEHLKQCAEAVAFDQNALCVRIKEIDFAIATLYQQMTERQKKFAKYAEQVHKIQEMHSVLNRIKMNVDQTTALMERLNSVLPPEEQLEPFSMKIK